MDNVNLSDDLSDLCGEVETIRENLRPSQKRSFGIYFTEGLSYAGIYAGSLFFGISHEPFQLIAVGIGSLSIVLQKDIIKQEREIKLYRDAVIGGICFVVGEAIRYKLNNMR